VESGPAPDEQATQAAPGPASAAAPASRIRAAPPSVSARERWENAALAVVERLSTAQLFALWLAMILLCGAAYWLSGFLQRPGLIEEGVPVAKSLRGMAVAMYFSAVTATSVGYGDVLPVGPVRVLAVAEAVAGLLIFGLLVAKFVSRRQEELVREIHSVTFEERLDRVQTNLHLVLSELQAIAELCDGGVTRPERLGLRLESASLVFASELRAIRDLLYNPQRAPGEPLLGAILAGLASALTMLSEVLACLPGGLKRSAALHGALRTISTLAEDICAECVPQVYTPALTTWMDRIQEAARSLT
jgi:hypothetical protein